MTIQETDRVAQLVRDTIVGDAALAALLGEGRRYWRDRAEEGALFPCVVGQLLVPYDDLMGLGAARIWSEGLWRIKTCQRGESGRVSTTSLRSIADRLDELLHASSGSHDNGIRFWITRQRPWERTYLDGGFAFAELGADWRIKAQAVAS